MIQMSDGKRDAERWREVEQDVQEANGIRAAGYRNRDAAAARQHVITSNGFSDPLQHGELFPYCSGGQLQVGWLMMEPQLQQRAAKIRLLLMDVDGVLTNCLLYNVPGADGDFIETKGFNAQDGIALQWLAWSGIQTGVISGRVSKAMDVRAGQVGMSYVYQGHIEKVPILEEIVQRSGWALEQIAYAGDDLTDVPILRRAGLAFAPANARPEVKRCAHHVTAAGGGDGAVREIAEILLKAQGHWDGLLKKYEVE
jgi:3-deoxy-D-manno-octulosonate 8-phosphate phosphatase (KDO 8-P phosphatase)